MVAGLVRHSSGVFSCYFIICSCWGYKRYQMPIIHTETTMRANFCYFLKLEKTLEGDTNAKLRTIFSLAG